MSTTRFNPGHWQIIAAGGADIGMLDVEHRPGEIYLARIEIHPDHQGHGLGTHLISALLDEARQNGPVTTKRIRLYMDHRQGGVVSGGIYSGVTEIEIVGSSTRAAKSPGSR